MAAKSWAQDMKICLGNLCWVCNSLETLTDGENGAVYKELVTELRRIQRCLIKVHQDLMAEEIANHPALVVL